MMFHLATLRLLFFVLDNQRAEANTQCVIANHQILCQPQPSTAKGVREKKEKGPQRRVTAEVILQPYKRESYMCNCSYKQQDRQSEGLLYSSLALCQRYSSIIRHR